MHLNTLAQYYSHPMMDGRDYGNGTGMMLFSLLLFIGLIIVVVYLVRGSHSSSHSHSHTGAHAETSLEIAKKRYAAGEITKPEFEQLKKDLA